MSDSRDERFALLELDIPGNPKMTIPVPDSMPVTVATAVVTRSQDNAEAERAKDARKRAAAEAEEVQRAQASGSLVAGAAAEGAGILCGWVGSGEIENQAIAAACERANWSETPALKSPERLAARAIKTVAGSAYVCKSLRKPKGATYAARWVLIALNTGDENLEINAAAGRVDATIELDADGFLRAEGTLNAEIAEEFARLIDHEMLAANDVTTWLQHQIVRSGGVRLGTAWYVPRETREKLEALLREVSTIWGRDWLHPLPVATTDQLRDGLAAGLAAEVAALAAEIATVRAAARERGAADVGARGATSYLARLADLDLRVSTFAGLLGPARLAPVYAHTAQLRADLGALAGENAQRFAALDLH